MPTITKHRTIRLGRKPDSPYRIHIDKVTARDTLEVKIDHERKQFNRTYTFRGSDVVGKKSLSFRVFDKGNRIEIIWNSTQPVRER